eukprot:jgi/Chlat1/6909/Chrsp52S06585
MLDLPCGVCSQHRVGLTLQLAATEPGLGAASRSSRHGYGCSTSRSHQREGLSFQPPSHKGSRLRAPCRKPDHAKLRWRLQVAKQDESLTTAFATRFKSLLLQDPPKHASPEKHNAPPADKTPPKDRSMRIRVASERHIATEKEELAAVLLNRLPSKEARKDFLMLCSSVESILHEEHRSILEWLMMQLSRHSTDRSAAAGILNRVRPQELCEDGLEYEDELGGDVNGAVTPAELVNAVTETAQKLFSELSGENGSESQTDGVTKDAKNNTSESDAADDLEAAFVQLLTRAKYLPLSPRDLDVAAALNEDYLLTLPVEIDQRGSSSNVLIYRRGYSAVYDGGRLLGQKLDHLQAAGVRLLFNVVAFPVYSVGRWLVDTWRIAKKTGELWGWARGLEAWLDRNVSSNVTDEAYDPLKPRYLASLSSAGTRGRWLRRLMINIGLLPEPRGGEVSAIAEAYSDPAARARPQYVQRISLRELFERVCEKDDRSFFTRLRQGLECFWQETRLEEPAFKEVVVMYRKGTAQDQSNLSQHPDYSGVSNFYVMAYKDIPMADLKVVFPDNRLRFRIADVIRVDLSVAAGLFLAAYPFRFRNPDSLQALALDIAAISTVVLWGGRALLEFKRSWDRYQLFNNRTLYEKTVASSFGVVHVLVDASEDQQFKLVVTAYCMLLQAEHALSAQELAWRCETFLAEAFLENVTFTECEPVEALLRLGLAELVPVVNGDANGVDEYTHIPEWEKKYRALPLARARTQLQSHWMRLLQMPTLELASLHKQ